MHIWVSAEIFSLGFRLELPGGKTFKTAVPWPYFRPIKTKCVIVGPEILTSVLVD